MQTFIHITRAHNEVSAALYMFDYICDPPEPKDFDSDREVLNNLLKSIFAWYLMNILKYIIEWSLLSATIFWKSLLWNLRFLTMWSVPMGKSTILLLFWQLFSGFIYWLVSIHYTVICTRMARVVGLESWGMMPWAGRAWPLVIYLATPCTSTIAALHPINTQYLDNLIMMLSQHTENTIPHVTNIPSAHAFLGISTKIMV